MNILRYVSLHSFAALLTAVWRTPAFAQEIFGEAPIEGLPDSADEDTTKEIIVNIITIVLNFLALIAVIVIIIGGIRMIISQGDEEAAGKTKKTIFYALIGLLIVLFARVIVSFVTDVIGDQF